MKLERTLAELFFCISVHIIYRCKNSACRFRNSCSGLMQSFYILDALVKYYIPTRQHLTVRNGWRASQVARTKEYKQHHNPQCDMFNAFSLPWPSGNMSSAKVWSQFKTFSILWHSTRENYVKEIFLLFCICFKYLNSSIQSTHPRNSKNEISWVPQIYKIFLRRNNT